MASAGRFVRQITLRLWIKSLSFRIIVNNVSHASSIVQSEQYNIKTKLRREEDIVIPTFHGRNFQQINTDDNSVKMIPVSQLHKSGPQAAEDKQAGNDQVMSNGIRPHESLVHGVYLGSQQRTAHHY